MKIFLYSSSVYSCHLVLISAASVRSIPFLSFIEPIFAWNVPLVSLIFSKRSLVFPILLFSSISLHWSLSKAFLSLLAILWNSEFKWNSFPFLLWSLLLFFHSYLQGLLRQPFCLFAFLFLGDGLDPHLLYNVMNLSIHSSSGTLSDLIPWIYFSLPLYNHKRFDLGHTWIVEWFTLLSSV